MNKFRLLCAAAAIVAPASAYAQETTSSIRGEVTSGGSPVANAEVVVTHVPSGSRSTATTGPDGGFSLAGLRVGGPFTVAVTASGMQGVQITDIFLQAGQPFRIPVELGGEETAIIVTGVRGARQTSNGPITGLNREAHVPAVLELLGVPYTGSDPSALVLTLDPQGVVVLPGSGFGEGGEGFFRISFIVAPERLAEAARRAGQVLQAFRVGA